jgi:hypothetical protein
MLLYDHDNGVVIPDLLHRREVERALFLAPKPPPPNPLDVLTRSERQLVDEYDADERHPRLHARELATLKARMTVDRKAIWLAAERGQLPDRKPTVKGWEVEHRAERYRLLLARTR